MKKIVLLLLLAIGYESLMSQLKYVDAAIFPLYGKVDDSTETRYERLPARLKNVSRDPVWRLGKNTAGLAIRFRTNSKTIGARWETLNNTVMNHMPFVAIKGLDLYCYQNGHWQFVNSGRPIDKSTSATIISNLDGSFREYMLYLPLYDGLVSLEIGVDSLAEIATPDLDFPTRQKPLVFYGTSITQGACASRPGMAYPSQIGRLLNRETINLGFSGNGQLDIEIAHLMTQVDASIYVLDFVPNVTVEQIKEKLEPFVEILRRQQPQIPILLVENAIFPHSLFDTSITHYLPAKNRALKQVYLDLKKKGYSKLYYLDSKNLIGNDFDATVDGIHFTDFGFYRFVEKVLPAIERRIK